LHTPTIEQMYYSGMPGWWCFNRGRVSNESWVSNASQGSKSKCSNRSRGLLLEQKWKTWYTYRKTGMCIKSCTFVGLHIVTESHFLRAKAAMLSARLSYHNSVRLSVCLSICLSHGWIRQKRSKLRSPNFHHRLPGRL